MNRGLVMKILPSVFADDSTERLFLQDFRLAGLRSASYACCVAVAGYLLIGSVDILFHGWSSTAALRRVVPMLLLSLIILLIYSRPTALLRHYNELFGSLVLVAYVCSVSVTHLFRQDDPTLVVNPTALIGLWIIYGFVRLPLKITIWLGLTGGGFALLGSRVTNMPDPMIRTFIYLLIANALGITLARSIEIRERELFQQKRILENTQTELRHRSVLAEQASAEKTRLIAAVGHDLRQPMMAAILHLSVLLRRLDAHDMSGVKRQAEKVQESVELLSNMLEHLLLAARYESGTHPLHIQAVSITRMFQTLSDVCEPQLTDDGARLVIRFPRSDTAVRTDEQVLLRALVNLVSNALKFSRAKVRRRPRVVVRAAVRGGICRIVVADNGIGIADSDAESVWQPFFQVGNRERNRDGGLGLGLYLTKQSLLRLQDHGIRLDSRLGRGTRLVITVPKADNGELLGDGQQSGSLVATQQSGEEALPNMYVLLVEDDHEARKALQTQLGEWGILSRSASCVREALQGLSESDRRVDAIIADYRLPDEMTGIDLIVAARSGLGYVPDAVLITAEVDLALLIGTLPERTSVLQKPFDPLVLNRRLSHALLRSLGDESDSSSLDSLK